MSLLNKYVVMKLMLLFMILLHISMLFMIILCIYMYKDQWCRLSISIIPSNL